MFSHCLIPLLFIGFYFFLYEYIRHSFAFVIFERYVWIDCYRYLPNASYRTRCSLKCTYSLAALRRVHFCASHMVTSHPSQLILCEHFLNQAIFIIIIFSLLIKSRHCITGLPHTYLWHNVCSALSLPAHVKIILASNRHPPSTRVSLHAVIKL